LTIASLVHAESVDRTLFFSDLDHDVRSVSMPALTTRIPERATDTFETIAVTGEWLTLTELAAETDQSKSTVIRHVQALEVAGVLETDTSGKAKRVRTTLTGDLLSRGWFTPH
jgi:CRISPR-associated protein Csa3